MILGSRIVRAFGDAPDEREDAPARASQDREVGEAEEAHDQICGLVDDLERAEPAWRPVQYPEVKDPHLEQPQESRELGGDIRGNLGVRTAHHLGIDVHDLGTRTEPIKAGMVFTIEPGIYIEEEKMGVRIENNFWVTKNGNKDLMKNIPITVEDIEALMKK